MGGKNTLQSAEIGDKICCNSGNIKIGTWCIIKSGSLIGNPNTFLKTMHL